MGVFFTAIFPLEINEQALCQQPQNVSRGRLGLVGLGRLGSAEPGASGMSGSAFSTGAAFSPGAGSATTGSAFPGAGCSGAGAVSVFSTLGPIFFLSSANVKPPFREMKKASPMAGSR